MTIPPSRIARAVAFGRFESAPKASTTHNLGGFITGAGHECAGAWGIVPGYLSERFPTDARAVGTGFTYHVGAGLGAFTPTLIGRLTDGGVALADAMFWCIAVAGLLVLVTLWLGPETRGQRLDA